MQNRAGDQAQGRIGLTERPRGIRRPLTIRRLNRDGGRVSS
jgi:hypothetical protein